MKNETRIVEVFKLIPLDPRDPCCGKKQKVLAGRALFHQWGVDYEEFDTGPGNYTVAIVEYDDGTVEGIRPDMIKFVSEYTDNQEEVCEH